MENSPSLFKFTITETYRILTVVEPFYGFVVMVESTGCRLFGTAFILKWLRNLLHHQSQGRSTERSSRNTLRVVNARVFIRLQGFLAEKLITGKVSTYYGVRTYHRWNQVSGA